MIRKSLLAAGLALAFTMPQAEAALFDFAYDTGTGVLAGVFEGTLQADNNTLVVSAVPDFVSFNGVQGASLPFVISPDAFFLGSVGLLPTVTVDGSFMDFGACTVVGNCTVGFAFVAGSSLSSNSLGGVPTYQFDPGFGNKTGTFSAANWSLTPHATVPAPDTLPLLALGGAAMGWRRRKQALAA